MKKKHAAQISDLINKRNQLPVKYDANKVLKSENDYKYHLDKNDNVIAAVEIKKVQWYQWELCHLTVCERHEGKGYGKKLIKHAEQKAKKRGSRLIQCTIREDNDRSKSLFLKNGYKHVSTFFNAETGNDVGVWQKVMSHS